MSLYDGSDKLDSIPRPKNEKAEGYARRQG